MITSMPQAARCQSICDEPMDDERFERFRHRRAADFPVRSHAARIRAKMRGRATAAGRHKARSFNGANRRGRGKQWFLCG